MSTTSTTGLDFIRTIVADDVKQGKNDGRVMTRFPPEPNGYLHIGHAKSICLNFGVAEEFGGVCNLRFDDTNPSREGVEYVDSIKDDVRWLGFDFEGREYYASDYFERIYEFAVRLVRDGNAYVDSLSADEIREHRGTLTEPGKNSPWRGRSVEENLDLLQRMREGEFPDGAHVLRAKTGMASPNMNLRDPVMYRILKVPHHRTGDAWCIYPTYDFVGLHRGRHPLHLHPGVRGSSPPLRLVHRAVGYLLVQAVRVRPAEPDPHHYEQAENAAARRGRLRVRVGRPSHADPRGD